MEREAADDFADATVQLGRHGRAARTLGRLRRHARARDRWSWAKRSKPLARVPTSVTATKRIKRWNPALSTRLPFAQHAHLSFGTINQADWWTANLNPGTVNCPVVVNIDAYESLVDEHRDALDSSVQESLDHYSRQLRRVAEALGSVSGRKRREQGRDRDDVIAEFRATAADPIRDAWIADMEAQGLPGQELYDLVVKTLGRRQNRQLKPGVPWETRKARGFRALCQY